MALTLPEEIRVLMPDNTVKRMLLEDYLRGVTAAALPADAPLEAYKALTVAARTFAANTHRHLEMGADVCIARHCQTWVAHANPRAARAAIETRSIVATHNDKLIEAFYFEHCDGKTRDAKGVLVNPPAYLKSVTCPCGFAFTKGHGIGMCQRGMLAMSRFGESYEYILKHYYSGIMLEALATEDILGRRQEVVERRARNVERPPLRPSGQAVDRRPPRRVVPRVEPLQEPPQTEIPKPTEEKPARKFAPRRSPRPKIEQEGRTAEAEGIRQEADRPTKPAKAEPPKAVEPKTVEPKVAPPRATKPKENVAPALPVTSNSALSAEADDLLNFLALEDVGERPTTDDRRRTTDNSAATPIEPRTEATPPPPYVPPARPARAPIFDAAPPPSMPEDLPTALELEFIAPPTNAAPPPMSAPEQGPEEAGADFVAPPTAQAIEADLQDFIPPVEKFYTPLDAPPSMPEELPEFSPVNTDATPITWLPPPPLQERAVEANKSKVLMDLLPGPRIIAGSLPKPGMIVTIRDARGNSVVTVSGVAKQYGAGGFEAPLTEDGTYAVKFDGTELDVKLENETAFIYYQ